MGNCLKFGIFNDLLTMVLIICCRLLEKRIQELEKDLFYYKKTSRELKHRLRDTSGSSTSTVMESVGTDKQSLDRKNSAASEKQPIRSGTFSDKSRESSAIVESEEMMINMGRVTSPEVQINKMHPNENFYLPPVQRVVQDEKKSKFDQKDGPRSQKMQKSNYDRLINQEEQKRLKVHSCLSFMTVDWL